MGKFVIGSSVDGYRFLLENFKGEVLGISPFFDSEEKAVNAIKKAKRIIPVAKAYDETEGKAIRTSAPRYVVYKDSNDMFRFTLVDKDGTVFLSSPAYTSFRYCVQVITSCKNIVRGA